MKYTYAYKTSDGSRHEASIEAASRDEAFALLRKEGIRPIKVVAADGAKANGEIRGVRKRVVAAIVAAAVLLAMVTTGVYYHLSPVESAAGFEAEQTRRYPIGDAAVIEKGILTGWSDVFKDEGERFLASFAVPGVKAGQRNTTAGEVEAALGRQVEADAGDGLEARQIKAMVEGMKREARAYIAAGGSIAEYCKRLTERQDAEIAVYERTKGELERARETMDFGEFLALWEERNDQLRNLGIKLIPLE